MWQINVILSLLPRSLVLSILGHLFSSRTKTHEMETEHYKCTLQMFFRFFPKGHILGKDRMRAITSKNLLDMYNSINTHGLNLLSKGEKYLRYETHSIWWMMFEIKTNSFVCFTTCLNVNSTCVYNTHSTMLPTMRNLPHWYQVLYLRYPLDIMLFKEKLTRIKVYKKFLSIRL